MWKFISVFRSYCYIFGRFSGGHPSYDSFFHSFSFGQAAICFNLNLYSFFQAHVFSNGKGSCAAFLANYDTNSAARVTFNKMHYNLPPWSISILPDCKNVVFNTAKVSKSLISVHFLIPSFPVLLSTHILSVIVKVGTQTSHMKMASTNKQPHSWASYGEDISSLQGSSTLTASALLDQLNVTRDSSDYLWYMTR